MPNTQAVVLREMPNTQAVVLDPFLLEQGAFLHGVSAEEEGKKGRGLLLFTVGGGNGIGQKH